MAVKLTLTDIDFLLTQLGAPPPVNGVDPVGLRSISGVDNNLQSGQAAYGAADIKFILSSHQVASRDADPNPFTGNTPTAYDNSQTFVVDSTPREISNLVANQTTAIRAAPSGLLGLPASGLFALFGQFFTHDLDFVPKGDAGVIYLPLLPGDSLYSTAPGANNFMMVSRANFTLGPDANNDGSLDRVYHNTISAYADLGPTYGSHPVMAVFLREYDANGVATGRLLTHTDANPNLNVGMPHWSDIKVNALRIGITLTDQDVLNLPQLLVNADGTFVPDANGDAQLVVIEGVVQRTGHAFLDDIAHGATPGPGLLPDADTVAGGPPPAPGFYDNELLAAHFIAGDGRINENYGLTTIHGIFHAEHNRVYQMIRSQVEAQGPAWTGEQYFQAARLVVEAEYQQVAFEEYAYRLTPNIDAYSGYDPLVNPGITTEFAHSVFRFGHSQLAENVQIIRPTDQRLFVDTLIKNFLNPLVFATTKTGTAMFGLGSVAYTDTLAAGMARQVGMEVDEFMVNAMRNALVGLPLDLAAINIARGRDTGIPSLNAFRADMFSQTGQAALAPYDSWTDFGAHLLTPASLKNFIMAYAGADLVAYQSTYDAAGWAALRTTDWAAYKVALGVAATAAMADAGFMGASGNARFNDIDLWLGGLAEAKV
ncbi:MAG: peroxidase family protein, partial [Aquabacterium sp.]